jgi:hypothetical protein
LISPGFVTGFVTVRCCTGGHRSSPNCDQRGGSIVAKTCTVIRSISDMIGTPPPAFTTFFDPTSIRIVGLLQALAFVRRTLGQEISHLISNILLDHSASFLYLPTEPTPMDMVVSHFELNRFRHSREGLYYCHYVDSGLLNHQTMDHVHRCWECGARTPFQCGLCEKQTPICNEGMCKNDHYQLHNSIVQTR